MAARPFKIDNAPPAPLSVDDTAELYGVSKSALNEIKAFVSGFLNGGEPSRARSRVRRHRSQRLRGRQRAAGRSSAASRLAARAARSTAVRKASRRKK